MTPGGGSRLIRVDALARVEGEGALHLRIKGREVLEARLEIFEPPRFFEALLRGRAFGEVPDITARICGICPVAYQMSAVQALEAAAGVEVDGPLRDLRRLLYCGEWIESHALHVFMLHAPDFLGYEDAFRMGRDHPELLRRALRLKKTGNEVLRVLGGREIHPINVRVGGFYRCPDPRELDALRPELEWALEAARETVRWAAGLPFPEFERDYEFVALRHPAAYPMSEGRIVSNKGLDVPVAAFDEHVVEEHVPHSTALRTRIRGRADYHVGPLARLNLNADRLPPLAADALAGAVRAVGRPLPWRNPFHSIIARSVELVFACEEALRLLAGYQKPPAPHVPVDPRNAVGHGCTEAPRGILYHRYAVDGDGLIREARIVPPTAQNQWSIEADLRELAPSILDLSEAEATWRCEQAVRNYDPCISCATHFLRLKVERL